MIKEISLFALFIALGCSNSNSNNDTSGSGGHAGAGDGGIGGGGVGGGGGGGGGASNQDSQLGDSCSATAACTGNVAPFCLTDPTNPTSPGVCVIVNCDSAACGDAFDCCDCSNSAQLKTMYAEPRCFPTESAATVSAHGCTCT